MAKIEAVLHTFHMGDVEDPYLFAAFPLHDWQQTEHGQWVMAHTDEEPVFYCDPDPRSLGYRVTIIGKLEERDYTYYQLKWGQNAKTTT